MRIGFKRFLLFSFLLFVAFVGWFFYQLLGPSGPITVSPQTTVLTTPLADDGLPDYSKALLDEMREGVTPENNGAIPFLKAMWPAEMDPAQRQAICKELEMDLPETEGMEDAYSDKQLNADMLEQLATADRQDDADPDKELAVDADSDEQFGFERDMTPEELREHHVWDTIEWAQDNPWRRDEIPLLGEWIDRHAPNYELLHEAAAKPKFYLPSPAHLLDPNGSFVLMLMPEITSSRTATRCLLLRSNFHLGEGDPAAAWRDCRAIYDLTLKMNRNSMIGELVSVACEGIAGSGAVWILDDPNLSPKVAQEMLDYLKARPPRKQMADVVDHWERISSVTAILDLGGIRKSANADALGIGNELGPLQGLSRLAMDWNLVLRISNKWFDRIVQAMKKESWEERQAAAEAVDAEIAAMPGMGPGAVVGSIFSRSARSENMANVLAALTLPAFNAVLSAEDRTNTQLQILQTAAALAVFHLEQGEYPDSLEALVPKYLDSAPVDLFHGNALVYQKKRERLLALFARAERCGRWRVEQSVEFIQGVPCLARK